MFVKIVGGVAVAGDVWEGAIKRDPPTVAEAKPDEDDKLPYPGALGPKKCGSDMALLVKAK